jgi:hypothetical protein
MDAGAALGNGSDVVSFRRLTLLKVSDSRFRRL